MRSPAAPSSPATTECDSKIQRRSTKPLVPQTSPAAAIAPAFTPLSENVRPKTGPATTARKQVISMFLVRGKSYVVLHNEMRNQVRERSEVQAVAAILPGDVCLPETETRNNHRRVLPTELPAVHRHGPVGQLRHGEKPKATSSQSGVLAFPNQSLMPMPLAAQSLASRKETHTTSKFQRK